ncbi:MAG TPA: riboflavin synthase, partial [Bacillota bacterium]|nr:riboflavin synthase [Bacillota bacterium]
PETWKGTNLSRVRIGDPVNLEPALEVGGRLGGHWVSGHVDGLGQVSRVTREQNALVIQIKVPAAISRWLTRKGSIAVNGVSLTVQQVVTGGFVISLIPHTVKETTFQTVTVGEWMNLETDPLLKLQINEPKGAPRVKTGITAAFLAENGFLH